MAKNLKDSSKASKKDLAAKKKAKIETLITIIVFVVVAVVMTVAIMYSRNNNKNKPSQSSQELVPEKDYTECREAYCNGLTEDGKIESVKDINSYVKLGDIKNVTLYTKDFPLDTDKHKVEAGMQIIENIIAASDVVKDETYYEKLVTLYQYIYTDYYNTYKDAYDKNTDNQLWKDMYAFLSVTEAEYIELVSQNANRDMKRYLVVQALVEKYGIDANDDDILAYAMYQDFRAQTENSAETTLKHYGKAYVKQRADEYVLALKLIDEVNKVDGSITDNWTSEKEYYSANLYENGRIQGIGDINVYCELPDMNDEIFKKFNNADELITYYLDNSKFKEYDKDNSNQQAFNDYYEAVEALLKHQGGEVTPELVKAQVHADLVNQAIFDKYQLKLDTYKTKFFANQSYEEKVKASFIYGDNYVNKTVIAFAVRRFLTVS